MSNLNEHIIIHQNQVKLNILKSCGMVDFNKGIYANNIENRKLGRVGQQYGGKSEGKTQDLFGQVREMESELDSLKHKVKMQVPYRSLKPKATISDYYISTKTEFEDLFIDKDKWPSKKEIEEKWEELKKDKDFEFTQSPSSSSQYLVNKKTGDIYRKSDHWGGVASCYWKLDNGSRIKTTIAKSNIKDFQTYDTDHPSAMVRNPEYNKKGEPLVEKLINKTNKVDESEVLKSMKKEGYNDMQIELAKEKFSDFKGRLIKLKYSFQYYKENK